MCCKPERFATNLLMISTQINSSLREATHSPYSNYTFIIARRTLISPIITARVMSLRYYDSSLTKTLMDCRGVGERPGGRGGGEAGSDAGLAAIFLIFRGWMCSAGAGGDGEGTNVVCCGLLELMGFLIQKNLRNKTGYIIPPSMEMHNILTRYCIEMRH